MNVFTHGSACKFLANKTIIEEHSKSGTQKLSKVIEKHLL